MGGGGEGASRFIKKNPVKSLCQHPHFCPVGLHVHNISKRVSTMAFKLGYMVTLDEISGV